VKKFEQTFETITSIGGVMTVVASVPVSELGVPSGTQSRLGLQVTTTFGEKVTLAWPLRATSNIVESR
jgi:hypothetical protein